MAFEFKEHAVGIEFEFNDLMASTIKRRMNAAYENAAKQSALSLYLDRPDARRKPPTMRERVERRYRLYRDRIRDAWLVLIGREQIGSDY